MTSIRSCAAAVLVLASLGSAALAQDTYNVTTVITGAGSAVGIEFPRGDSSRAFIVDQNGIIRLALISGTRTAPVFTLQATPFLNVANLITGPSFPTTPALSRGSEQGLLGLALDPNFNTNGIFYINYTAPRGSTFQSGNPPATFDNGRTVIARYQRDPNNPNVALPTGDIIFQVDQPFTNHNGGRVTFGPDGMLWIGTGDGGSGNDPLNDALDPNVLLGKMIRLDVSGDDFPADPNRDYRIPAGNAYPGGVGGAPEIWARGLRNPWRFSFDRWNGNLWIGDVGQDAWEEHNRVPSTAVGLNFGWRVREGFRVTGLATGGFDVSSLTDPIYVYPQTTTGNPSWVTSQLGESTVGGYAYRGNIRGLRGRYLFTDTLRATFWSMNADVNVTAGWAGTPAQVGLTEISANLRNPSSALRPVLSTVVSMGEDNEGELYIIELSGRIRKIVADGTQPLIADVAGANQSATPDGLFTADDIIVFLGWFFANDPRADIAGPNQAPAVDQALTADDIIVFLSAYFDGR